MLGVPSAAGRTLWTRLWQGLARSVSTLHSLPTAHHPLRTAYCILPTAYCILHTAYCILHTAYCPLRTAYCVLHTAHCPLPTSPSQSYPRCHSRFEPENWPSPWRGIAPWSGLASVRFRETVRSRASWLEEQKGDSASPGRFSAQRIAIYPAQEETDRSCVELCRFAGGVAFAISINPRSPVEPFYTSPLWGGKRFRLRWTRCSRAACTGPHGRAGAALRQRRTAGRLACPEGEPRRKEASLPTVRRVRQSSRYHTGRSGPVITTAHEERAVSARQVIAAEHFGQRGVDESPSAGLGVSDRASVLRGVRRRSSRQRWRYVVRRRLL